MAESGESEKLQAALNIIGLGALIEAFRGERVDFDTVIAATEVEPGPPRGGGSRGNCPGARAPLEARRKRSHAFPLYVAMISPSWAPQGARKIELSTLVQRSFILENSTTHKNHLNQ